MIFSGAGVLGDLLLGQRDDQALGGLLPFELAVVTEQADVGDMVDVFAGGLGERPDHELAVLRPAERDGVERRALGGEADFLGVVLEVLLKLPPFTLTALSP